MTTPQEEFQTFLKLAGHRGLHPQGLKTEDFELHTPEYCKFTKDLRCTKQFRRNQCHQCSSLTLAQIRRGWFTPRKGVRKNMGVKDGADN